MVGIYKITNPIGQVYIGQSKCIEKRRKKYRYVEQHKNQPKLYGSYLKYGAEKHIFELVCECHVDDLNTLERYHQDLHSATGKNGLNGVLAGKRSTKVKEVKENKNGAGRKKIIGGISKKLVATAEEWEFLDSLIKTMRSK